MSNKEKVCLVWETKSGKVKRTRFHKPTSSFILARKKKALPGNPKEMKKSVWVTKYGEVDPEKSVPTAPRDIRFEPLTIHMKAYRHENKHIYRNAIY